MTVAKEVSATRNASIPQQCAKSAEAVVCSASPGMSPNFSREAVKHCACLQTDPSLFNQYHDGFQQQTESWPVQPIDQVHATVLAAACEGGAACSIAQDNVHAAVLAAAGEGCAA